MALQIATAIFVSLGASGTIAAIGAYVLAAGLTVGFTVAVNALVQSVFGPSRPKPSDGQQESREAVGSRRRHYGIVHTGGQLSFFDSGGGVLAKVLTLGTGREDAILEHRINNQVVNVDGTGTVTDASFHGAIHIYSRPGADDQTAIAELTARFPTWTADHRQRGCAHAAIVCDPVEQEDFAEVYNNRVPEYSQVRKAARVYDPRKDSTAVIGEDGGGDPVYGAGSHRLDDESTWEWSDDWTLVTADYWAHPDGYGGGYENVNWTNIAQEAAYSEAEEVTVTGATIARWRIWASYSLATEERRHVLADMLKAGNGFCWQDEDCKFNLMCGRFVAPDITLTDDHILGLTATLGPDAGEGVSAMKVIYTEAAVGYREQESATVVAPDADDDPNTDPQALFAYYAPHHNQAVRLGKITLAQLGERWHITALLNLYGLNLLGQRFTGFSSAQLGVEGYFKIDGLRLNLEQCTVEATLSEVKAEDWNFDAATEEGTPPLGEESPTLPVTIAAPEDVSVASVQIALGETFGVAIAASWADSGRPDYTYEAQYRPTAGGDWVAMTVDNTARTARSGPVDSGTEYAVRIRARTIGGRASAWSASATITPASSVTGELVDQLAAYDSTLALWDASSFATLRQGRDGSGFVTSTGQPVGRVLDQSGNGRHLIAPTDAARPLSTSGLLFDDVDDQLDFSASLPTGATLVVVYKGTDTKGMMATDSAGATRFMLAFYDGNTGNTDNAGAAIYVDGASFSGNRDAFHDLISDGAPHVIEARGVNLGAWSGIAFGSYPAVPTTWFVGGSLLPVALLDTAASDYVEALADAADLAAQQIETLSL